MAEAGCNPSLTQPVLSNKIRAWLSQDAKHPHLTLTSTAAGSALHLWKIKPSVPGCREAPISSLFWQLTSCNDEGNLGWEHSYHTGPASGSQRFRRVSEQGTHIMGVPSAVSCFSSFLTKSLPATLDAPCWPICSAMAGNTAWELLRDMQFRTIVLLPGSSFCHREKRES